jgi:hypothetical protein
MILNEGIIGGTGNRYVLRGALEVTERKSRGISLEIRERKKERKGETK